MMMKSTILLILLSIGFTVAAEDRIDSNELHQSEPHIAVNPTNRIPSVKYVFPK